MDVPVAAPCVGLLVIDGVTLDDVTRIRERLEIFGAHVIVVVPSGGPILPVSGRYFPGAGGSGVRRPVYALTAADLDLLILPAGITRENLLRYPDVLQLIRGHGEDASFPPVLVFQEEFLRSLLERGITLQGLAGAGQTTVTSGARRP